MSEKSNVSGPRKAPMSQLEVSKMRKTVLTMLAKEPRACFELEKRFKLHKKTMMTHLYKMQQLGMIHATRATTGRLTRYMWHVGPGESVARKYKPKPEVEVSMNQHRVTSWPPCKFQQQHIWSAVMG